MISMNTMPYRSIVGTSCSVIVKNERVSILHQAKLPIEFCDSLGAKKEILRLSKSKDILDRSSARRRWPSFAEWRSCVQKALDSPIHLTDFKLLEHKWFNFHAVAIVVGACILFPSSAYSVDALKTCTCLLRECRLELARCVADPLCAANVACLQTCNNRPDETECQIKCGDLFENSVVDQFNDCAVSKKGCVPQKSDDGRFPVPPPSALVRNFRTTDFTGKWFISSGLNPSFDTFDCQLHEFFATPGKLQGNISWRVNTPDGGFITRKTVQNFVQDPKQPGVLYNHGNEFLHYKDDWYILSSKIDNLPDDYIFIYYKGSNDAWDGYGGAVVYTRSRTLPSTIVPALKAAAKRVGLNFENFKATDNTCNPEPPLLARLEKSLEKGEQAIIKEVEELEEQVEEKVESAEMQLLGRLGKGIQEFQKGEQRFIQELSEDEKAFLSSLKMEAEDVEKLFGKALAVRKFR